MKSLGCEFSLGVKKPDGVPVSSIAEPGFDCRQQYHPREKMLSPQLPASAAKPLPLQTGILPLSVSPPVFQQINRFVKRWSLFKSLYRTGRPLRYTLNINYLKTDKISKRQTWNYEISIRKHGRKISWHWIWRWFLGCDTKKHACNKSRIDK